MKRFFKIIIKCILVTVPIWGMSLFLCLGKEYYSNEDFGYTWWNQELTQNHQEKHYKCVILGDSSCNSAYMPEVISDSIVNLSIGGCSTVEEYYVLEDYLANNKAPTDVFLSFHDSHFKYTEAYWDKIVPAHRFNLRQNLEIIYNSMRFDDESFKKKGAIAEYLAAECYFPSKYITSLQNSIGENRFQKLEMAYDKIELHGGRYTTLGKTEFVTAQDRVYSEMLVKPMYDYYFTKTIDLCTANNINVHIVKPPVPDNSVMTLDYQKQVIQYYNSFAERYDNVTFNWDIPIYDRALFADEIHLNNDGALAFSEYIKTQFKDIFSETRYTSDMMAAVNDSIQQENILEYLMRFVGDRDYTVLIYDNKDVIEQFRNLVTTPNELEVARISDTKLPEEQYNKMYVGSNFDNQQKEFEIREDNGSFLVSAPNAEENRWIIPDRAAISLCIIDNVNDEVVAIKNVEYSSNNTFVNYTF